MDEIPLSILFVVLVFLLLASAFFSGSETSLMSLNRYRLRHLARKYRAARLALHMLEKPSRLIGGILLGNNFVNILAATLATLIGQRLWPMEQELGVLISTITLTIVMIIFSEVTPKTLGALKPERFAFPAVYLLEPMLKLLHPVVWLLNQITRRILALFGISEEMRANFDLSTEELRTVVNEAATLIPQRHQQMLLNILDLEKVTVDDIMVPRNEIAGIDLEKDWDQILTVLAESQHTKLPVYEGDINKIVGVLHLRRVLKLIDAPENFNKDSLRRMVREPYFVPEGTALHTQLLNFQRERLRMAMIVNEYGDILGLVTLEDILEEIVGEFTTNPADSSTAIHTQDDGSYLVDGTVSVRELNRLLDWNLPLDGPKTLNGLIIEYLEHIPDPGTSLRLAGYPMDVVQTTQNAVKTVRVDPTWQAKLNPEMVET